MQTDNNGPQSSEATPGRPSRHADGDRQDRADHTDEANEQRAARRRFATTTLLDVAAPLAVFYGLRLAGVNQWWALIIGGAIPLLRVGYGAIRRRRLETAGTFTLTVLLIGTGIGLLTGDPRLLLARESYLTAVVGAWILATLLTARPFLLAATIPLLPAKTAEEWHQDWHSNGIFRRTIRLMTAGWGLAFLLDAIARVIMAYTLPLDWVPGLSVVLLILMLITVVQGTKTWARRHYIDGNSASQAGPQETPPVQ